MKVSEVIIVLTYLISIVGIFILIILVSNIKVRKLFNEVSSLIENKQSLLNLKPRKVGKVYYIIKRWIDIIASLTGLIIMLPVICTASIFIKLLSKGPVFTKKKRIGKDGKVFYELKFRTIKYESINKRHIENTDYTKIGIFLYRTSIDMLPNLINVLLGDMTFIGVSKRSKMMISEVPNSFKETMYQEKPGMVVLWALSDDKQGFIIDSIMYYDIYYLCNRSFFFDIAMFFRTVWIAFAVAGEY